ncbi:hypothetical protein BGW39_002486 [Mortierella sp. 14UC]|nr:hypothetical protein BGW39_002486 [Mortierella sp. 14UC]
MYYSRLWHLQHCCPRRALSLLVILPDLNYTTKIFPASLQRKETEFFSLSPEGDSSCNMPKPATFQKHVQVQQGFCSTRETLNSTVCFSWTQSPRIEEHEYSLPSIIYGVSDSDADESSCDEDDDSDKKNEDPEAPRLNKEFKKSGAHPPQLMPGTELEKPLGSGSTYSVLQN